MGANPAASADEPGRHARAALLRVVNPGTVAAVFYLALLFVLSRMALSAHLEAPGEWLSGTVRYLRQTLISGLCVLLAIGLAEALLDGRRLPPWAAPWPWPGAPWQRPFFGCRWPTGGSFHPPARRSTGPGLCPRWACGCSTAAWGMRC